MSVPRKAPHNKRIKTNRHMGHMNISENNFSFIITAVLGIFTYWTKSDVAIYLTMMAAVTTIILNIIKISKERKK